MGLNIVIVGSGLGGLAAAVFLRAEHNVILLEKTKLDLTYNDYGISIISNAYGLLQKAGIREENLELVEVKYHWRRTQDNKELFVEEFDTRKTVGVPSVLTKRSRLQRELYRMATCPDREGRPAEVIDGSPVLNVDTTTGTVYTVDGKSYSGDLVIGADGINSVVRSAVLSGNGEKSTSSIATHDLLAYIANVPISALQNRPDFEFYSDTTGHPGMTYWWPPEMMKNKRRIAAFHMSPSHFQLTGFAPEEEFGPQFDETNRSIIKDVPASRAQAAFPEFTKDLTDLFALSDETPGTVDVWRLRDIDPIHQWSHGRTLLIGDAAHAVTPHLGQDSNISFEDAEALGVLLRGASELEHVQAMIPQFVQMRQRRAHKILNSSRHFGAMLSPDVMGDFDRAAFARDVYGYTGAEAFLERNGQKQ